MLIARQTRRAILPDAPTPPQTQRTKHRRPNVSRFNLQPARDIRGRFRINMLHAKHVMIGARTRQAKTTRMKTQ
jgi:hypothetical protein